VIGLFTPLIAGLGRRAALYGSLALALIAAFAIALRQGHRTAEASYAIRRANARIRALQTAKDTRHDVETASPADRDRRLERWMRD
jgi:ADP-dependent phosphofructokinase/glucokinase